MEEAKKKQNKSRNNKNLFCWLAADLLVHSRVKMWKEINTHSSDKRWSEDRKLMIIYGKCVKRSQAAEEISRWSNLLVNSWDSNTKLYINKLSLPQSKVKNAFRDHLQAGKNSCQNGAWRWRRARGQTSAPSLRPPRRIPRQQLHVEVPRADKVLLVFRAAV